jgi:GT2 family glycosyltransferase
MTEPTPSTVETASIRDSNVAVVTVNYRTPELTKRCIAALAKEREALPRLRAVVVDGGSGDGSADQLAEAFAHPDYAKWVEFLPLAINGGFGWANDQGILSLVRQPQPPDYIHLLNPDAEVMRGAVGLLVKYLANRPRTAAVGSQLVDPDGTLAGSAFSFPSIRGEFSRGARTGALDRLLKVPPISIEASEPTEVDWVTGGSVMFRVEALRQVGLFDEGFFLYNEEIELMWRLRKAGWNIATHPGSRVRHVGGVATGVHDRETAGPVEPRRPAYLYRSRARFFGLTRGRIGAIGAFAAFLAGHVVWKVRRVLGISSGKPVDHEFRDHVRIGRPRRSDFLAATMRLDGQSGRAPVWMERRWL